MKLNRLKEISESWERTDTINESDLVALIEVIDALPGLLRVCDAHMAALIAIQQWNGATYERAYELSEKKLEELL